jgi:NAD+ kinase
MARTVGLIPKLENTNAAALTRALCEWLLARGATPIVEQEAGMVDVPTRPGAELAATADLLIVLGGDGTLLHAASLCAGRQVPILGINLGTLGYLTEVPREKAFDLAQLALEGKLETSRRLMLSVEMRRGGQVHYSRRALNELVIAKGEMARLARLLVEVDGRHAALYVADGIIVATPTGSTAYSLSAGGPIVHPAVETLLLTPLCPHALTQRPLVLPPQSSIEVTLVSDGPMFVAVDGSRGPEMVAGDHVRVQCAGSRTLILRNPEVDPFGILRAKLGWGAR